MNFQIKRATKSQARLKLALIGVAGSGKTFSALSIAHGLGERVLVIDTEHGSASKYAEFGFDVIELDTFNPQTYIDAIQAAEGAGYDVLIIDSLSHAWSGKDGALELVDNAAKRDRSGNSFGAWRNVTPLHNAMIDAIVGCRCHLIATMRAKTDYVQEKDTKTGRTVIRKVGMAPVQRDGMEYEFDVVGEITAEHDLIISKSRASQFADAVINKPGHEFGAQLKAWLSDGVPEVVTTNGHHAADHALQGASPDDPKATDIELAEYTTARAEAVRLGCKRKGGEPLVNANPEWTGIDCVNRTAKLLKWIREHQPEPDAPVAPDDAEEYPESIAQPEPVEAAA